MEPMPRNVNRMLKFCKSKIHCCCDTPLIDYWPYEALLTSGWSYDILQTDLCEITGLVVGLVTPI